MDPACSAYVFEANAIQKFVLEGGRLRDMVGASHMVDGLCSWPGPDGAKDLVQSVLAAVDLAGDARLDIPRRAGGALVLLHPSRPRLERFRRLWTLSLRLHAPGLDFTDSLGGGGDPLAAVQCAYDAMRAHRNIRPASLPMIGPMMAVAPRTGRAAVARQHDELLDAAIGRKRLANHRDGTLLPQKIGLDPGYIWPVLLDRADGPDDKGAAFPFLDDNRYLAVIHADGNGLGKVVSGLLAELALGRSADYPRVLGGFSQAVDQITRDAVAEATTTTVLPSAVNTVVPMRPLVVGGDDVTVIVRADLALDFVVGFLEAFRRLSRPRLAELKKDLNVNSLPDELTAGAGVVFAKARQPFYRAYDLCESLAAEAKRVGKKNGTVHQCLAFHRVTTMAPDASWDGLRQDMTRHGLCLGMGAYAVDGTADGLPSLSPLLRLRDLIGGNAGFAGPLREIAAQMHDGSLATAQDSYARWRQVQESRAPDALREFDTHLSDLGVNGASKLAATPDGRTPILDAVTLVALSAPSVSE